MSSQERGVGQNVTDGLNRAQRFERQIAPVMLLLSLLFLPVFLLGFWPELPPRSKERLEIISWVIWSVFVVEFVVRLMLAPDRIRFLRSSILDLLVIALPFLRVFRVARAIRAAGGVGRAMIALGGTVTLGNALAKARRTAKKRGDRYVIALVGIATAAGAAIILNVERDAPNSNIRTLGDALWWATSTVTTVGYGDRFPTTTEGRLIAVVLMILGLGLFSVVTARVATFFIVEDADKSDVSQRLERIEALLRERQRGPGGNQEEAIAAGRSESDAQSIA